MKPLKHWQDLINALLGVILILSPWLMGYADMSMAMYNAVLIGAALVAASLGAILVPRAWEEWTECALGAWMVVSPWVLGFNMHRDAMVTAVTMGLVIAALALWTLFTDKDYSEWWRHDRTAH